MEIRLNEIVCEQPLMDIIRHCIVCDLNGNDFIFVLNECEFIRE